MGSSVSALGVTVAPVCALGFLGGALGGLFEVLVTVFSLTTKIRAWGSSTWVASIE